MRVKELICVTLHSKHYINVSYYYFLKVYSLPLSTLNTELYFKNVNRIEYCACFKHFRTHCHVSSISNKVHRGLNNLASVFVCNLTPNTYFLFSHFWVFAEAISHAWSGGSSPCPTAPSSTPLWLPPSHILGVTLDVTSSRQVFFISRLWIIYCFDCLASLFPHRRQLTPVA